MCGLKHHPPRYTTASSLCLSPSPFTLPFVASHLPPSPTPSITPQTHIIFEEGDPCDRFFIIHEGRVGIFGGELPRIKVSDDGIRTGDFRQIDDRGRRNSITTGAPAAAAAMAAAAGMGDGERGPIKLGELSFRDEDTPPWFGESALHGALGGSTLVSRVTRQRWSRQASSQYTTRDSISCWRTSVIWRDAITKRGGIREAQ